MKKVLSVILSVIMAFSVFAVSATTAMAAVGSIESTSKKNNIIVEVNGQTTTDVVFEVDPNDPNKITFTYTGDGELIGWEFNITEGQQYEVISEEGNSITILLINGYDGEVIARAIIKTNEGGEGEETTKKTVKPNSNKGDKSPKTGVAAASGLAVAGAGVAILTALKKKNDAE